jgi:hypothetical protein
MSTPVEVLDQNDEPIIPDMPSDDSIQAYVHHHRVGLVKTLMKDGKMPEDKDSQQTLLAALKDMDSSANTRRRINADSKNAAQSAQAAATIARLFTTHPNLSKRIESVVPAEEYTPPELGSDIPRPQLVEGETSTQVSQQSYDTFMAKFPTPGEDPQ